ncbi:hypothetical protein NGC32_06225 [Kluyvera cryocrescens]|uniref:hypothetical protein n=1 Tax=Kluyvera cryocrescens TaxID=580 RepID=UPI002DBDA666|nr:hypothetical protein [Kluyvera cryocrescens]MEB7712321.1 hypothetical protein [Kluyvera cryocrescens]
MKKFALAVLAVVLISGCAGKGDFIPITECKTETECANLKWHDDYHHEIGSSAEES